MDLARRLQVTSIVLAVLVIVGGGVLLSQPSTEPVAPVRLEVVATPSSTTVPSPPREDTQPHRPTTSSSIVAPTIREDLPADVERD